MSDVFQAYRRDMTEDEVRQAFREKYHYEPERVWRVWDWYAGPIRSEDADTSECG